jgi:hypothetical protein
MNPPRESDGPGRASAPWWAWIVIGICAGYIFALAVL